MKIKFISFLFFMSAYYLMGQTNGIDVSFLPKANYVQRFTYVDRWGQMIGNLITVDFTLDSAGRVTFNTTFIEAEIQKGISTYMIFPTGGSETDIYMYPLLSYSEGHADIDFEKMVKKKIFMWGAESKDKAIQIDDLLPGYYFVDYASCHYSGSYLLQIKNAIITEPSKATPPSSN